MTPASSQHLAEDGFGDVGFDEPGDLLQVLRQVVGVAGAPVELERVAADDFAFADIGSREPAGYHAADVLPRFEQDGLEAHSGAADGGDGASGGPAVDDEIVVLGSVRDAEARRRRRHFIVSYGSKGQGEGVRGWQA